MSLTFLKWVLLALVVSVGAGAVAVSYFGLPVRGSLTPDRVTHEKGHAYVVDLPRRHLGILTPSGDGLDGRGRSDLELHEDGARLDRAHSVHDQIRRKGEGRFSHWNHALYFSATDNSDPRTNGRSYAVRYRVFLDSVALTVVLFGCFVVALGVLHSMPGRRPSIPAMAGASTLLGAAALSGYGMRYAYGVVFWLALGACSIFAVLALLMCRRSMRSARGRSGAPMPEAAALLLLLSVSVVLVAAEGLLAMHERSVLEQYAALAEDEVSAAGGSTDRSGGPASDAVTSRAGQGSPCTERGGVQGQAACAAPQPVALPDSVRARARLRRELMVLPREWKWTRIEVEGAHRAMAWHGVVHVYDENGMRRSGPFPPKREGVFRVMVVGDSLTYGDGIDERHGYVSLLERELRSRGFAVEMLNLGREGANSSDVLDVVRQHLPRLEPDLVIYGVCLNDFLPSGWGQSGPSSSVPSAAQRAAGFFIDRSRLGQLAVDAYRQAEIRFGWRLDFYGQVLDGLIHGEGKQPQGDDFRRRFAQDVAATNELVRGAGLPPVLAMVLDQLPVHGGRGHRVAMLAERLLEDAGMEVVETSSFYAGYSGSNFSVSRWEGHPNEIANAIFAGMLLPYVEAHLSSAGGRVAQREKGRLAE